MDMSPDPSCASYGDRLGRKHLLCSLSAIISSWLLSGIWHALSSWRFWHGIPIGDHIRFTFRDLVPWMIWTGIFCGIGWFVVGLPLARKGDRALQKPIRRVVMAGLGGVAIMLVPLVLWSIPGWQFRDLLSLPSLWFCGIAFVIAAVAALLYECYLALANRVLARKASRM